MYEAYETSELTTTLNRNSFGSVRFESSFDGQAFHHFIRSKAFLSVEPCLPAGRYEPILVRLSDSNLPLPAGRLNTFFTYFPFKKKGKRTCYLYTQSHSFYSLFAGIEPCSPHSQSGTLPISYKQHLYSRQDSNLQPLQSKWSIRPTGILLYFIAVRKGVEPFSTDRQSAMLAVTPTNLCNPYDSDTVSGELPYHQVENLISSIRRTDHFAH